MKRMLFASILAFWAAPARADTLPLILDTPASYVQGTPFTVDVRLPGAVQMTDFSVELLITTAVLNPQLDVTAEAVPGRYVFPSTANFATSQAMVLDSNVRYVDIYTLFPAGPANLIDGANDTLGRITITPGANVTGPIMITVNDSNLILTIGGEPPPEIILPVAFIDDATPPSAVPTPAAWMSLAIGGLVLAGRRRMVRQAA